MKRRLLTAFIIGSSLALAACNTVEGAGRDVSSAGQAVSGAAQDAK